MNSCWSVWPKTIHVIAARKMQTLTVSEQRFALGGVIKGKLSCTCDLKFRENDGSRFPFADQNIISQLWQRPRNIPEIIMGVIGCTEIDQTGYRIILRDIIMRPGEDQLLRSGSLQPGVVHAHEYEIFWMPPFNLANHLALHLARILLRFH